MLNHGTFGIIGKIDTAARRARLFSDPSNPSDPSVVQHPRRTPFRIFRGSTRNPSVLLFLALAVALVCVVAFRSSSHSTQALEADHTVVVQVGETTVTRQDVMLRQEVERCYRDGQEVEELEALLLLIQDAQAREVARLNGLLVLEHEVAALARHAEETSRAPQLLHQIQRVFEGDEALYRRSYLEPKVIDRKLREFQSRDRVVQPYDYWFQSQVAGLITVIKDERLYRQLREKHREVWWLDGAVGPRTKVSSSLVAEERRL